jgi:hypothetical protein
MIFMNLTSPPSPLIVYCVIVYRLIAWWRRAFLENLATVVLVQLVECVVILIA